MGQMRTDGRTHPSTQIHRSHVVTTMSHCRRAPQEGISCCCKFPCAFIYFLHYKKKFYLIVLWPHWLLNFPMLLEYNHM